MNPEVSIIIPAKNEAANISRCLDAIKSQETARKFEIIVIDSGSTDGTGDIAAKLGARVITIPVREFDHGRTRNLGLSQASGKYLITLVADALPADGRWMEELIAPLEKDPSVAGAYSRQLPRPDTHPLEKKRILDRFTAGSEPIVNEWPGDDAWKTMEPERRMYLANFDDVSAVRRRSVWEKIPVAENYWGEDLDWSLKALKAGHRIAFAPASKVLHAHRPALIHSFRRAYVDQTVVLNLFGMVYFANASEFKAGLIELIRRDHEIIRDSEMSFMDRIGWRIVNPLRRLMEVAGAYLAADMIQHVWHPVTCVYRDLYWSLWLTRKQGNVLRTTFSINGDRRNTVFAHPPSNIRFRLRAPSGARLEFYPAINPQAWDMAGPVTFEVTVNGLTIYEEKVHPADDEGARSWNLRSVDLGRWLGKEIDIEMITRAEITDNAWAGWGSPCIMADRESFWTGARRKLLKFVSISVYHGPMRHP